MLKRNLIANYAGQAWCAAMGLVFVPVYIRYLGMESYGLIGVFAMMQAWFSLLDMGMTPTLLREMARYQAGAHSSQSIRELLSTIEVVCFGLVAVIALVVWAASGYLANNWLKAERLPLTVVAESVSIMGFVVALRFAEGIYRGSLYGLQQQVWHSCAASALATLRHGGAVLVLVWGSPTVSAFFTWQAVVSLLTVAILGGKVHRTLPRTRPSSRFSSNAVRSVWRFAASMLGISVLGVALTQTDKVLLSRLLPLEAFGHYALAVTLTGTIILVISPITQSVLPRLVELCTIRDQCALVSEYHRAASLVTVVTAPVTMLLAYFGAGVVVLWSGNAELGRAIATILLPLSIGTFLNGLIYIPYQCQLAHGWTALILKTNLIAVAVLIPALLWTVPRYGVTAAAWCWVALNSGHVLVGIHFMHMRVMRAEKWTWYFRDVMLPMLGSLLVGLALRPFQPSEFASRPVWFAFLALAGLLALAVSAMLTGRLPLVLHRTATSRIVKQRP